MRGADLTRMKIPSVRDRWRDARGAVMVEAAITLPVLMLLLFGLLEYGLLFRTSLSMSDAVRSGARVAVAQPRTTGYHLSAAAAVSGTLSSARIPEDQIGMMVVYRADPRTGGLKGGGAFPSHIEACNTHCWKFDWDAGTDQYVPRPTPSWSASSQFACGTELTTDYLGVYIKVTHRFVTEMLQDEETLTERTVMRLEPLSSTDECRPSSG